MRLPVVSNKLRFHAGWLLVAFLGAFWLVMFAAQLKAGTNRPVHTQTRPAGCSSPSCATIGDHLSVVLDGSVSQVSEPQPGVVCVEIHSRTRAGTYCQPR